MRLGTCFSGIGAPEVATAALGWQHIFVAEVEPFPAAVLAARFPDVPNLGDVTKVDWPSWRGKVDVMVGGPPCQDFSVAGKRAGLDGARGNLSLTWVEILDAVDPTWSITENVPGWLSDRGNAFGTFLGAIVGGGRALLPPGGGWRDAGVVVGPRRFAAWRVFDAQYFGVPQRRRRVFIVARRLGEGADPVSVLFERQGVRGHSAARGEAREEVAGALGGAAAGGGGDRRDVALAVTCHAAKGGDPSTDNYVADTLLAENPGPHRLKDGKRQDGSRTDKIPIVVAQNGSDIQVGTQLGTVSAGYAKQTSGDLLAFLPDVRADRIVADPISANEGKTYCNAGNNPRQHNVVAFDAMQVTSKTNRSQPQPGAPMHTISRDAAAAAATLATPSAVRRLTPRECERLQGFPDDHTLIEFNGKPAADGPRYKACGNSMAVPVLRWLCERITKSTT